MSSFYPICIISLSALVYSPNIKNNLSNDEFQTSYPKVPPELRVHIPAVYWLLIQLSHRTSTQLLKTELWQAIFSLSMPWGTMTNQFRYFQFYLLAISWTCSLSSNSTVVSYSMLLFALNDENFFMFFSGSILPFYSLVPTRSF